ncbi:hypothetical protein EDD91_5834 [Streptomyces sp. KS 21]|nr:hypothetical protein EDD91_5834 [Streptomyces sp. KS 21]
MGDGVAGLMAPGSRLMATLLNRCYKVMPNLPGKDIAARMARKTAEITLRDYGEWDRLRPRNPALPQAGG